MASPKHSSIVLFIAIFTTSLALANARESQFFSKATKETTSISTVQVPGTDQHKQQLEETSTKQQEVVDEPNFIPQTTPNGYGLYGHETGLLPPSATTTSAVEEDRSPYKTTTSTTSTTIPEDASLYGQFEDQPMSNNLYEQIKHHTEKNHHYYNKDAYANDEERASGFGSRYASTGASLADRNNYYAGSNKDAYVTDQERGAELGNRYTTSSSASLADRNNYYTSGNTYSGVQRQGMSDTRFMQNGKYFYDINNEEKYYPNYRARNSRITSRSGEYNPNMMNGRYNGNTYKNPNYEYNGNSMEGYEQNREEFQDVQDALEP